MLRRTVRPAVVRRGLVAGAVVVGLVLFGVAELSASIESSTVPVADAAMAAPYGGLSGSGAGFTVLPVVPDRPLPDGVVASAASVGTMQPLGMAFTLHGYTIGLYAKPAPAAQGWSRELETLAIGPASLEMTFAGPEWLHGFGLLILPDSAPPDSRLRVTVRDLEGQFWTLVVPRLPARRGGVHAHRHAGRPARHCAGVGGGQQRSNRLRGSHPGTGQRVHLGVVWAAADLPSTAGTGIGVPPECRRLKAAHRNAVHRRPG